MGRRSAVQLQGWREISARVVPFVRSTEWTTAWYKAPELALPDNLSTFLKIAPTLPNLVKLDVPAEGCWPEIASALPLGMRERMRDLSIQPGKTRPGVKRGSSVDAAVIVQGFPFLTSLNLTVFVDDGGGPALIAAIQSLCYLKTFTSWDCTALIHSSLSNDWQGSPSHYDSWTVRMPMSLVRSLIITLGGALQVMMVGIVAGTTSTPPLPPLPLLHSMDVALQPDESSVLSPFLVNLHLRHLLLIYIFEDEDERLDYEMVAPFLLAPAATLQSLSIGFDGNARAGLLFDEGEFGRLQALADEKGVGLSVAGYA